MSEGRKLLPCPNCGDDLLRQHHAIAGSQVTLAYGIVGELEVTCEKCSANVGPFLTIVLNNHSWFAQELIGQTNVFGSLVRFVETLQDVLDSLPPPEKGGKLSSRGVLEERFGLKTGEAKTTKKIAEDAAVSRTYVYQTIQRAIRELRYLQQLRRIHNTFWTPPDSIEEIIKRAEEAEIARRQLRYEIEGLKRFLGRKGLLDKAFPDVPRLRIEDLGLSPRICRTLKLARIETAANTLRADPEELLEIYNFGGKSFRLLAEALLARGIDVAHW